MPDNWARLIQTTVPSLATLKPPVYGNEDSDPAQGITPPQMRPPLAQQQQSAMSQREMLKQQQAQQIQQAAQVMPQTLQQQLDLKTHTGMPDDPTSMIVRLMAQLQRQRGTRAPEQMLPRGEMP